MGEPGNWVCKRTHGLFVDNLEVYGVNHKKLDVTNEAIVKASTGVGAAYGVSKCAEVLFERGVMKKGEGLDVLEERMFRSREVRILQVPGNRTE